MIELRNISKIYKTGTLEVAALNDVSFTVEDGEFISIMGASGSGKSTLLNILGCLDVPTSGRYLLDGIDTAELSDSELASFRNQKVGFVFQTFNLLPRLTALANVELPLIYSNGKGNRREKAIEKIWTVNLEDRKQHRPQELSGGQQQRVAIARALICEPSIILADEPTGNLDSASGKEIMSILVDLNKKGITVITVTHDPSVASHAHRIIRVADGKIEEDREIKTKAALTHKTGAGVPEAGAKKKFKRGFSFGELKESLSMALVSVFLNKLRSFLTMLGIIVGVGAVIAMIAIGEGASAQITARISQMGSNLLMVRPGFQQGPARSAAGAQITLTVDDALAIANECPSVAKVDANVNRNAQVVYKNKNANTNITGATPNYPEIRNFPVAEGSFITDEDNRLERRVAVLGKTVVEELFGDQDPIGEYIKIQRSIFQVIGVMSEKGGSGFQDQDDVIFVPLLTAMKRLLGVNYVRTINVEAKSRNVMAQAQTEVTNLLRERHKKYILPGQEDDFTVQSQSEILSTVQATSKTFTLLLAGIAIVSLIVGGIGIMNIMFVSVTERTREIGIRKAIGAQRRDILGQFLIEAIIVSLSGGIIGIGLGMGVSKIMGRFGGWNTVITPGSVLLAFCFAFAVGLFFGFYPARKASGLNPIEALRYE
jgi:macrolide transport system ATP-binding/permease protein